MPIRYQFCSGISRKVDFAGVVNAGMAPGVQAGDLYGSLGEEVFAHVERGGALFVDSGAFPAFMAGGSVNVDFDAVLSSYEALAGASSRPSALYVVAPDKVADPEETLRLLQSHYGRIEKLIRLGVSLLVPVQLGSRNLVATWSAIQQVLTSVPIIPAMPMRAAAANIDQVISFLQESGERKVHLLGTSKQSNFDAIGLLCPGVDITADANRIRAYVGEGRPITEEYRACVQEDCCTAWGKGGTLIEDGTDFIYSVLNDPGVLSESEVSKIVDFIGHPDASKIRSAILRGELGEVIEEDLLSLVCMYPIPEVHAARVARKVGAGIRQQSLTKLLATRAKHQTGHLFAIDPAA